MESLIDHPREVRDKKPHKRVIFEKIKKVPARTKIVTALIYFDLHVFVICVELVVQT